MSKHATEWLNAYLDGELKGSQLRQVEMHLVECEACRTELESLARLSSLLHEVPAPEFTPPERFAAQVSLRLPHRQVRPARGSQPLGAGWWMVPVGLLAAWVFIGTSALVNEILSVASNLGLLTGFSNWFVFNPASDTRWSVTLGQIGLLGGRDLNWAAAVEALTRGSLPQITLHASIAFLYLGWMAIWWARRRRQGQDQLLEG